MTARTTKLVLEIVREVMPYVIQATTEVVKTYITHRSGKPLNTKIPCLDDAEHPKINIGLTDIDSTPLNEEPQDAMSQHNTNNVQHKIDASHIRTEYEAIITALKKDSDSKDTAADNSQN